MGTLVGALVCEDVAGKGMNYEPDMKYELLHSLYMTLSITAKSSYLFLYIFDDMHALLSYFVHTFWNTCNMIMIEVYISE